jgi:hypothetical protein
MAVATLLNAVVATGAGTAVQFSDGIRAGSLTAIVQAVLAGTATAVLQGSLNGTDWFTVYSFTASGAQVVELPLNVRGNCTAWTSGAVTLLLDYVAG